MATGSFYGQISANKRNSFLMAGLVVVVLGMLGFAIGYAVVGSPAGGVGALVLAVALGSVSGVASYFGGDKLVLTVSGAKPVDEASAPQLLNIVREMAIAANIPMPAVYLIDDSENDDQDWVHAAPPVRLRRGDAPRPMSLQRGGRSVRRLLGPAPQSSENAGAYRAVPRTSGVQAESRSASQCSSP